LRALAYLLGDVLPSKFQNGAEATASSKAMPSRSS
jgi:hypothetical protein